MNEQKFFFVAENEDASLRIDQYLSDKLYDFTRSRIQKIINDGGVTVNDRVQKKNYRIAADDEIRISVPENISTDVKAQNITLDIIFEDEHLLVVNKPKGMVVHPAPGNSENTLVNALLFHCDGKLSGINGVIRPGIVHRIDKDTSGLLVVAKSDVAHIGLAKQFAEHSIDREYHAVVCGNFKEESGTVNAPIGRNPKDRKKMAITYSNSKRAVTHYEVIKNLKDFSYIKCRLETGRTHQIRVHMASLGHSVAGDEVYGTKKVISELHGQCLHAKKLGFIHPVTGEKMMFDSALPKYFTDFLNKFDVL